MKKFFRSFIIFSIILVFSLLLNSTSTYAFQNNSYVLNDEDLSKINENINKLLSSKYESMKTLESINVSNIIEDPKLSELIDKNNKFFIELTKKVGAKIDNYTSVVNIDNLEQKSNDTFITNVSYSVEFKLSNSEVLSKSGNEKYRVELTSNNGNWYINKLLDLHTDIDNTAILEEENKIETRSITNITSNLDFPNYENTLDAKIATINNVSNNIDEYYENLTIKPEITLPGNYSLNTRSASSYSGYNRSGAVEYAHKWANDRNPEYKDFGNVDCTNFVSQCAYEGGGIPSRSIPPAWTPANKNDIIVAKAWTSVNEFYDFMTSMGYASSPPDGVKHGDLGDIIQFYNSSKSDYTHAAIITKMDDIGMYYSAHSNNRYDYPVWLAFDGTYTNIRLIKFW